MMAKHQAVKKIFDQIATKYDLIDTIISLGLDQHWRKVLVDNLKLSAGMRCLDCGAGSGKVTELIYFGCQGCDVTALDITDSMFNAELKKYVKFVVSPAETLPFPDASFDRVSSAFLTRNLADIDRYFSEVYRVLKPGGVFVNMDIYNPTKPVISELFSIYFYKFVPFFGNRATGSKNYTYLANTVKYFYKPTVISKKLRERGFSVDAVDLFFGVVYLHRSVKT
ncbi:class I SAM-dependent methyltransferase [Thermoplasma sp.]|uniref:class I SAM-dependent methyltransferase n=1 Tax=Thermoplasma sp. TaxID=1973142 RepID=UPI001277904F|nr:class I SAM-dependent methyltransferase [Thermoplasma sp.]KAA8921981.1 MAG: ubiquinone/menaquinone biosynthesis methyltransferase [Thermoplasma sp.]